MAKMRYRIAAAILTLRCAFGFAPAGQNPPPPKEIGIDFNGIRMDFVLIPAGSYVMGDDNGREGEKPAHRVTITRPFYLAKFEVTREQYSAVMLGQKGTANKPDYPADFVRWEMCREFLARMKQIHPDRQFRMPTEAEWEYAARAGTATRYWFGSNPQSLQEYAWFGELAGGQSHPVGKKRSNPWGLYDMYGNVWEWCQDFLSPYDKAEATDPQGPASGRQHVFRGGAWNCSADRCTSAARDSFPAAAFVLGLRVAISIESR
jgi:formylglycine-generating enzyme required for sulfatase activity